MGKEFMNHKGKSNLLGVLGGIRGGTERHQTCAHIGYHRPCDMEFYLLRLNAEGWGSLAGLIQEAVWGLWNARDVVLLWCWACSSVG